MNRMHSCWLLWISIILIYSSLKINGFYLPEMKPDQNKVIQVNDSVTISCKVQSHENISLYLNNNLLRTNVTEIKYSFRRERPGVYQFHCKLPEGLPNMITITYRYAYRVRSVEPLITGLNSCHMVVKFGLDYFTRNDYIAIERYDDKKKSFESCQRNLTFCEFQCRLFETYMLQLKLTALHFQTYTFNTTINASSHFYKLDKMNVTISAKSSESLNLTYGTRNENSHELENKKQFPNSLYRIFYKSEWDETEKILTTNKTEIQLEDLMPYRTYTINVQAKLNGSIYWSDNVTLKERTPSSAPYAGPKSTNGSYLETTCAEKSKRCFVLYWAMIPMPLRNGIFDRYVIQQDNRILLETSEIYVQIKDQPQNKDLWFEIRARNNDSQLSPPTVIHIPPKAPDKPKGVSVVRLNNTHVNISWALEQSLENVTVTVMSCYGEKNNSFSWCKSEVMWTKIQNKNFTILKTVVATNFLAAVYVSNSEGSSSLTFAKCILSGGISKPPSMPIIQEHPYQLSFAWPNFSCKDLNGRPTLFQVLYAEGNSCTNGSKMNISAIGTRPETENIEIKDLKPFTKYAVCLRIQTEKGWSKLSSQKSKSTAETNPSSGVRNLKVVSTTSSSVTLKWDPTLKPNGIITHQFVFYDKGQMYSITSNNATVSDLKPLTKYSFTVSTCNKAGCSVESSSVPATTSYDNEWVLSISLSVIFGIAFLIICITCSRWLKKKYEKTNIEVEFPDEFQVNIEGKNKSRVLPKPPNFPDKIPELTMPNWPKDTSSDDSNISNGHTSSGYVTIDSVCEFESIGCENGICSCTEDMHHLKSFTNDNKNNSHLKEETEMANLSESNSDSNHILSKLDQASLDSNGYVSNNINSSDLSQTNSDSNGYVSNKINLSDLSQTNSDSNGYVSNNINSSDLSQTNSDSNGYVSNKMNLSDLSQTNSDSNGYVSNKMNLSDLSQTNSNSNPNPILSKLDQVSLDSNGYVSNNINSSDLSQTNSDSNGYVSNKMNLSDLSQTNSNSNPNPILSKLDQVSLDSNGYVSNNINSSDLSQTNSDSNGYVSNKMNLSDLSQTNSNSNPNPILSKLDQVSLDSNGYVSNNMNSSELNQTYTNSNRHREDEIASKFSQANSDYNDHVII